MVVWTFVVVCVVLVLPGAGLPGAVAVGVEVLGTVAVVVVWTAAPAGNAFVTVVVLAGAAEPEPPASFTNAAASTPNDSTAATAATSRGALQLGDAARRVRAAAPQRRHHSCSACSGAPHNGHASVGSAREGAGGGADGASAVATLTSPEPRGG